MRILVNYQVEEKNYLPVLQYHLRQRGLEAIATSQPYNLGELLMKAQSSGCKAILLCNAATLQNCVPGTKPTLDMYRGSRLNFSIPTLVCNSLAHTQTIPHGTWLLGKDLDKFKTIFDKAEEFEFTALTEVKMFNEAFHILKQSCFIAYDIETVTVEEKEKDSDEIISINTLITCVSWTAVSHSGELKTFVLPILNFMQEHWLTSQDYAEAILFLRRVNALPIPKSMHNGMYDSLHSIVYHAEPHHWCLDTMAMMHSEFSELPKSLDFVASICLNDYIQWKAEASEASKEKDILRYWAYNGRDTWNTARITIHYLKHLPAYARTNYKTQFKFVYPFLYTAFEGIKVNQAKRIELRNAAEKRLKENLDSLKVITANPNFNPASPKQVQEFLYDVMGAKDNHIGMKKKDGKKIRNVRGTDAKNLAAIGEQHPLLLRITDSLTNYREAAKAISTYFDFIQRNGRLLYSINPFGTESGRASCQSSSFWCGTQVQNIPFYAKDMLVADEGYELFEIDNSQSEARCTAYLSQETNLIAALENPDKDFYKSLGTLFFNIPYEEVTKEFRNKILKKIVHGTNYMMGAATFIENAGAQNLIDSSSTLGIKIYVGDKPSTKDITLKKFSTTLLDSYHKPFPRVREWYAKTREAIASRKMLVSPLGHTRYFFGDITKDHMMLRSAVAHAPQNLSVSILNIGLWKIWELVKKSKGELRLKAQIHDSILGQNLKSKPELRDQVIECLQNPVTIYNRVLLIPTDCKIGSSWGDMTEL